jgi:hypothetical protein
VFFAPKANSPGHIVTCIRLEATKGSSEAVRLAGSYVIPALLQRGYIKSFEGTGTEKPGVLRNPILVVQGEPGGTDSPAIKRAASPAKRPVAKSKPGEVEGDTDETGQ